MCTAVSYKTKDSYFGRNLDLERSYGEGVVITPRNFPLSFRSAPTLKRHYALIGMATVADSYPLYFEATNEKGLSIAGLNFPDNAHYKKTEKNKINVSPFELIPYILGQCADIKETQALLASVNIADIHFSEKLPLSPLHWLISDKENSLTAESVRSGLKIYDNGFGVLTNNPTFDYHLTNISNYMNLNECLAENRLSEKRKLKNYSLGLGAFGLPGDFSSASRFVRAVFVKEKSVSGESEKESVSQFFHILGSVAMPKGCVMTKDGEFEYTRYSSCCNVCKGIYYYTTYNNSTVWAVDMHKADLEGRELIRYRVDG